MNANLIKKGLCMNESKMTSIIEDSAVAREFPLKSSIIPHAKHIETKVAKSEFLDDDVRSLVGEVYAG